MDNRRRVNDGLNHRELDRYVRRRKQAEEAGEYGLAVQFDDLIADESNHRDELQQMPRAVERGAPAHAERAVDHRARR